MQTRLITFAKNSLSHILAAAKKVNRLLIAAVSIIVSMGILGLLVYRQREVIIHYQWQFHVIPFIISFLVFALTLFYAGAIWGFIMNTLGGKLSYQKHIRYFIISNLAKRIPGTVWYVAGRFQLYSAEGVEAKVTAVASGIEMVLITLAGILVILLVSTNTIVQYHVSPIFLVLIFIVGVLVLHPRAIQWVIKKRNIDTSAVSYGFVLKAVLAYVISWILGGLVLFEMGNIIYPIPAAEFIHFVSAWAITGVASTLLFFSPSNFGITEIGISLLLSSVVPSSIAVLIALITRVLMILFEIMWTGLFLWRKLPEKNLLTQKD